MNPGRRRRITCLVLALLAPLAVGVYLWAACSPPRDKVRVRLIGLPADLQFYCLTTWAGDRPQTLDWYIQRFPGERPMVQHPGSRAFRPLVPRQGNPVRWRAADEYGVVTYSPAAGWRIYRFRADEVPVEGGGLFSSPHATFDLTGRPAEPLDPATVDQLGLSAVPQELADTPPPPPRDP